MSSTVSKTTLSLTGIASCVLLLASVAATAQTVTLTAKPTTTALPDGQAVPMWGLMCGTFIGSTFTPDLSDADGATCKTLKGAVPNGSWQPPLITVAAGTTLTINLHNQLSFAGYNAPTSLVIVGQLGGGLGDVSQRTTMSGPVSHPAQGTSWPGTPGDADAGACLAPPNAPGEQTPAGAAGTFCPPEQAARIRSLATEVATDGAIPVAPQVASGSTLTWPSLRPGTYLIQSGTQPSIQASMGLYGVLVVTDDATYPGVAFDKDVTLLLSEIDPVLNTTVTQAVGTPGFSDELMWNGQEGQCGHPDVHTCYPPAVNYSPLYFLVNGVSFDRASAASAVAEVPFTTPTTQGRVLLRFVNGGLRMHVPSIVGADMTLYAEDGNVLPGVPKKQSQLFLPAGKTYDVTIEPERHVEEIPELSYYVAATYPVFDRALSLSTNNQRDGGMQAYIQISGGAASGVGSAAAATAAAAAVLANPDTYYVVAGNPLSVSDLAKSVVANDIGIYGVQVSGPAPTGLSLNPNGTFAYNGAPPTVGVPITFGYCGNGATMGAACATVTLALCDVGCLGGAPVATNDTFTSNIASRAQIGSPGVLMNDTDPSGFPLKAVISGSATGGTVTLNPDGSFTAVPTCAPNCPVGMAIPDVTFQYNAVNSQNTSSAPTTATVTVDFGAPSGLVVTVKDGKSGATLPNDYRWIIEEDRTVQIDPNEESVPLCDPPGSATPPGCSDTPIQNLALNFYTSHMPVVAQGCVGTVSCEAGQTVLDPDTGEHMDAVCDVGNGKCRTDATHKVAVRPSQVHLDPDKHYHITILPGDGWITDDAETGHTMGGAQIAPEQTAVDVIVEQTPLEPAKIAVFVFQDDNPLNGEADAGGGVDQLAPNEAGLGGFNLVLLDKAGQLGDSVGQITYDMFGMPVSNSLANTIDPATGRDACPISKTATDGLIGMIVTCPTFEGALPTDTPDTPPIMSPLAGHAVIANMYAGFYEVVASAAADRIARGEEWLQTNTLDGTKGIEAFIKPGEPAYFQEFGPGGFHVAIGFANPKIINARKASAVCTAGVDCTRDFYGKVTGLRMSRTPDMRTYSSGSYDMYGFAQCYVSLGAPDSADFQFAKCDADGNFEFQDIPVGNLRVTVFDQWNDLLVDGLSTPITRLDTQLGATPGNRMEIPVTQWRTNLAGRVYIDENEDGVSQPDEPGLPLVPFNIRMRDGSYHNYNNTDLAGYAGFNEVFPILNWLVVDIDQARHKFTGIHVAYDAGGPVDGCGDDASCGDSDVLAGFGNTRESPTAHLPTPLRFPGSRYCESADCPAADPGFDPDLAEDGSTGRVDPGWVTSEGWQGLLGQNSYVEFGMKPFEPGENGGIKGIVTYTPTRPFDEPALLFQLSWAPGIPNVTVNLYRKDPSPLDGTETLTLVDTTRTDSWDDWAQGFRSDGVPNMNCPGGPEPDSPFYFTLQNSTQWLDPSDPKTDLPEDSRFKCYDGWSMLNQVQPAVYNGAYKFPSIIGRDPGTGAPTGAGSVNGTPGTQAGSNCTICSANPDDGAPMLPPGDYVVEVVLPEGYEVVKEEDKNILIGDAYIAPVTQQFAGFGNIFIMPDQAAINAFYNPVNVLQSTTNNGASPLREGDTGSVEVFWPCVGEMRIVPDLISLYPEAGQQAPFAGASRPLCDRKAVMLKDEMTVLAKFYLFTSTHIAGHFTGTITNDFASEFDPFSPQFGEKFAVPNTPVAVRDFAGKEIYRVYSDQWGLYNGLNYSTYSVWPPSPSGYIPQMMTLCMNDPGPILDTRAGSPTIGQMITDPLYNPAYSDFCYEIPFMPGQTSHLDTPVVPTMAFAAGYNLPDVEYPDTTPAIRSVVNTNTEGSFPAGRGPWVIATGSGHNLTITALGDQQVLNHAYSGPNATMAPYNQKFITRHYGFGPRPATCPASGACPDVTIAGIPMQNVATWTDGTIIGQVPTIPTTLTTPAGMTVAAATGSTCYNGTSTTIPAGQTPPPRVATPTERTNYRCGQLVVTAANGKKSIDTVTVTVAGTTPTYVTPASPSRSAAMFGDIEPTPLQTAIDNASPGSLILVGPGTYKEMLLMWKPVRLQGVGAASVTINGDAHPAGKLDPWRRQVNCVFGLALNGQGISAGNPYDSATAYVCPATMRQQADRNPLEPILGWDVTGNGNLAQMLQEPTLMGAYEGGAITVLAKGIWLPPGSEEFGVGAEGGFPVGYQYLTNSSTYCNNNAGNSPVGRDYGTSNFLCNPSRIDGVSVVNSSQGGGGIFAHGWNHYLEIANTRIHGNHGTLTGGITIGSGEFADPFIIGGDNPPPTGHPQATSGTNGLQAGYALNRNVKVHHNSVTSNLSVGDALYSGTNSGGGGVTFSPGADGYTFNNNWIAGNLSTGDGGGVVHSGFINDGKILNNWILFNQSASPTIPTNGGGLGILGTAPDRLIGPGLECGGVTDQDCPPGLSEGTGHNLVIDANLIMGNSAESGTGGGLRLQKLNGDDVLAFPTNSGNWNDVTITNNIIANNVAGWDGGGVSMQDALKVRFFNNTVVSNDTTASAGVLFNTLAAPFASTPPPDCAPSDLNPTCDPTTTSTNQPAGLVTMKNTPYLVSALPPDVSGTQVACPTGFGYGATLNDGLCRQISLPMLANNIFWQNRAFHVEVGALGTDLQNQQSVVTLVPALNQTITGFCDLMGDDVDNGGPMTADTGPVNYWEIGVRGDTSPTPNSGSGYALQPRFSILTNAGDYPGQSNLGGDPTVIRQYCNGSRLPPEGGGLFHGFNAPPGHSESTGLYPVFALNQVTVASTVDEGNNWINLGYGPLSLSNASSYTVPNTPLAPLGDYSLFPGSPATNNAVNPIATGVSAPGHDFFNAARPQGGGFEIGAMELTGTAAADLSITKTDGVTSVVRGTPNVTYTIVVTNGGPNAVANATLSDTLPGATRFTVTATGWTCSASAGSSCAATGTGNVTRTGTASLLSGGTATFTLTGNIPVAATGPSTNTVTITQPGGITDPNTANNTANDTDTIVAPSGAFAPSPVAFGNQQLSTTSAPTPVTFTNNSGAALTLRAGTSGTLSNANGPAVGLTGTNATNFAIAAGTTCTNNAVIPAGGTCVVNLTFTPSALGARSATLNIYAAASTTAFATDALSGTGVQATVAISAPSPALTTGGPNLSQIRTGTVTVTNSGTGPLTLTANPAVVKTAGNAASTFSITGGTCTNGLVVAPTGGTCTIVVQYNPNGFTTTATAHIVLTDTGAATTTQNGSNFNAN